VINKLSYCPTFYKYESFLSTIIRLLIHTGLSERQLVLKVYESLVSNNYLFPRRLSQFHCAISHLTKTSLEEIVHNHTLYNFYTLSMEKERSLALYNSIVRDKNNTTRGIINLPGFTSSTRYCYHCAESDLSAYNECYFRIYHFIPFFDFCPIHFVETYSIPIWKYNLTTFPLNFKEIINRQDLPKPVGSIDHNNDFKSKLFDIIEGNWGFTNEDIENSTSLFSARKKGDCTNTKSFDKKVLSDFIDFVALYSNSLAKVISSKPKLIWDAIYQAKWRFRTPNLLLLISLFINKTTKSNPKSVLEYNYQITCINKFCNNYCKFLSNEHCIQVSFRYKLERWKGVLCKCPECGMEVRYSHFHNKHFVLRYGHLLLNLVNADVKKGIKTAKTLRKYGITSAYYYNYKKQGDNDTSKFEEFIETRDAKRQWYQSMIEKNNYANSAITNYPSNWLFKNDFDWYRQFVIRIKEINGTTPRIYRNTKF
jgi:hypothetical protein